ncbi:hypothetical protein Bpfe_010062 [Biomphalaria pfeifferi]|uniref:Uncharacterized protein n=1 Tax=Biomphalaria pfeifferi TaxID=112525 RepID=A0AAD8BVE8_BIOPF|nr:hypothetical protein Bpfe_010062 [Biomphalaria pfeifferi]
MRLIGFEQYTLSFGALCEICAWSLCRGPIHVKKVLLLSIPFHCDEASVKSGTIFHCGEASVKSDTNFLL